MGGESEGKKETDAQLGSAVTVIGMKRNTNEFTEEVKEDELAMQSLTQIDFRGITQYG